MSDIFTDGTVKSEETENSRESDALKNIAGFQMHVSDEVKTYPRMYYTTDFQAFCFIMRDLTLRSSSLCSANLNDPQEQRRVGITNYAGSKFIVCFSHIDHEQVYKRHPLHLLRQRGHHLLLSVHSRSSGRSHRFR